VRPWQTLERVDTPEGRLELRQRGDDFLITIGGRVLMTSAAHGSEDDLARLACAAMISRPRPRVLLGGLGMGYTLRAALDQLPPAAEVTVVDLNPAVVAWCRGPLAGLTARAVDDRRVQVVVDDVARVVGAARAGETDAILLDLYEGPRPGRAGARDPLYGDRAVDAAWNALRAGGVLGVWSEEPDPSYEARLRDHGFWVDLHRGGGRGGRAHVVYVGVRSEEPRTRHAVRRSPGD
jgi:spermidine synthase